MLRVCLAELGLLQQAGVADPLVSLKTTFVDISAARNEQFEPWYLALNPKGVVPTLRVTTTGTTFLDELFQDELGGVPVGGQEKVIVTDTLRITAWAAVHLPRLFAAEKARRARESESNGNGQQGGQEPAIDLFPRERETEVWAWMKKIMAPHFGVLLYLPLTDAQTGECATISARAKFLTELLADAEARKDEHVAHVLRERVEGSKRFLSLLADPSLDAFFQDCTSYIFGKYLHVLQVQD